MRVRARELVHRPCRAGRPARIEELAIGRVDAMLKAAGLPSHDPGSILKL